MTQQMIRRAVPALITSMLVSAPALATVSGAVTSSNSNSGPGVAQPLVHPRRPLRDSPFVAVKPPGQPKHHRCTTRSCKRRIWLKHHPHPRLPKQADEASWYAPGGTMACGGEYTASDMGVANKTLPCGTRLRICYAQPPHETRGPCVNVTVMDRGPYIAGRVFDLQQAPKERLGFPGLGKVHWAIIR